MTAGACQRMRQMSFFVFRKSNVSKSKNLPIFRLQRPLGDRTNLHKLKHLDRAITRWRSHDPSKPQSLAQSLAPNQGLEKKPKTSEYVQAITRRKKLGNKPENLVKTRFSETQILIFNLKPQPKASNPSPNPSPELGFGKKSPKHRSTHKQQQEEKNFGINQIIQ